MDRRAAIRAYKETRRPMGIYRIRNTVSGHSVVGRSVDLPSLFNRERAQLRFGMHPDRTLQREWNELGAGSFAFEILDTLEPPSDDPGYDPAEDLKVLEALWRERLGLGG